MHVTSDAPNAPRPLEGIRVVDFTRVLSGPHATRMLADLGAEVIKVEPPAGDLTRFTNPRVGSMATYFVQQNVGKHNVSLDLTRPEAVDLLLRLIAASDVVVENFRPGVMDRLGLGWSRLAEVNPRLVYASISGYGATGPWVHRRAYAPVVGAETGITRSQGDARGGSYANDPHSHADLYASLECASAVLAALFQRERTGRGDWIDISMAQTMLYVNEHLHDMLWDGPVDPGRIRSFRPGDYPVLTTADGTTVIVSGHPAERGTFERYVTAMGRRDLLDDPRFADADARLAHLDEIHEMLRELAAGVPDAATLEEMLAAHELAMGVLRTAREITETDWASDREAVVEVPDRSGGTVKVPNSPWRFAGSDTSLRGEPRFRGEDNRTVFGDVLGLDDAELDALESAGILSSRVPNRS
jgi:CoA:oxalate CoA-transferase